MAAPRIQLVITESNISIVNNRSTVTGTLYYYGNGESWNAQTACSITLNGSTKNFSYNIGRNTNGIIGSYSVAVNRNSDGNKTISYSAVAAVSDTYGPTRTSGSYKCAWIKRATTPTLNPATLRYGESVTINLPRADSGFTHKLYYSVGNGWVNIATGIGTSYVWTIPKSLATSAKENSIKAITVQAETYSGGTLIGYKNVTLNVNPSADMVPTVSIALTDPMGYLTTYGGFVKSQSKIKCTLTEGLSYSSPIKNRKITIDGNNYTANPSETANPISSTNVTATIIDGRGMSASATAQPTLIDWYQPKLTDLRVQRCTPGGILQEDGACIRVDFAVDIAPLGTKKPNSKVLKISIKKQTEQNYGTPVTVALDGYKYQGYKVLTASGDNGYDVHIELTDDFATTTTDKQIGTAYTLMNWNASGKGMAFGKVSEKDEFEVAMQADFNDLSVFKNGYGSGSDTVAKMGSLAEAGGGKKAFNRSEGVGFLKVVLPNPFSYKTMINFDVDVYSYDNSEMVRYKIGGQFYVGSNGTLKWYGSAAGALSTNSSCNMANYPIIFGRVGDNPAISIGHKDSNWGLCTVVIRNIDTSVSNYGARRWQSGWQIAIDTKPLDETIQTKEVQNATNYVIEHGTINSINYEKWIDGKAECYGYATVNCDLKQIGTSGIYGGNVSIKLPITFKSNTAVGHGTSRYSTGHVMSIGCINGEITNELNAMIYDFYPRVGAFNIQFRIIGRWK